MACERVLFPARLQVPHLQRLVQGARDDPPAVRRDRHRPHLALMAFERALLLARLQVPHLQRLVQGARSGGRVRVAVRLDEDTVEFTDAIYATGPTPSASCPGSPFPIHRSKTFSPYQARPVPDDAVFDRIARVIG